MKKLLFIVNPKAGKTKSNAPLFDAVAAFSRAGYLVRVFLTEAGGEARTYAAKWGPQYDVVVCAGGDGTLNETISGLMELEHRPLLGYLPNGSTNDFAASLHLSSDPRHAAQAIASGQPIQRIVTNAQGVATSEAMCIASESIETTQSRLAIRSSSPAKRTRPQSAVTLGCSRSIRSAKAASPPPPLWMKTRS